MQKRLPIIIAAIIGLVAMVFGNSYLSQREKEVAERARILKEGKPEEVVVARDEIEKGVVIEERMVSLERIPGKSVQPRATNSLDRIVGKFSLAPFSKGEQILLNKVASNVQEFTSLAYRTPPGKRAITLPVDSISSVGGMIKPGDYVDILGVVPQITQVEDKQVTQYATVPLFQKVLVLAVGVDLGTGPTATGKDKTGRAESERASANTITVALSLQEATMLAFVQEQGKLRFVLRSPADSDIPAIQPANWDTLFIHLFPEAHRLMQQQIEAQQRTKKKQGQAAAGIQVGIQPQGVQFQGETDEEPALPPPPEVEIYRGTQREVIPLQK
ncbi:MAG: Flp pilus assembly protein CpaB [Candidatus Omnitrophota bacterium]|nr:Flp pilus assembly protein CpaB [Candidatus Omnitrophota bacterium]